MSKHIRLSLRAGERIFINGAVIRTDRKVALELMNDAVFLMESHVLQPEQTTTPLRQLYFVLQAILMDPHNAAATTALFHDLIASTSASFANATVVTGLAAAAEQVAVGRAFDALKTLRALFPIEAVILDTARPSQTKAA